MQQSSPNIDFIKTYPNQISVELCESIIEMYLSRNLQDSTESDDNLNYAVKECGLTNRQDSDWLSIQNQILPLADRNISEYLSFSKISNANYYEFSHMNFMHHKEFNNIPIHYDSEVTTKNNEIQIRNFAVLLYLNGDFTSGGELLFPVQDKIIRPEPGLMAIFPTSFMYPHVTIPTIGRDRFVLRFNYLLKKDLFLESTE